MQDLDLEQTPTFVFKDKPIETLPLLSKTKVAEAIVQQIIDFYA